MAEERKSIPRGVVVEFDFTAVDGAQILFDVAKKVLAPKGVDLTVKLEATHLVGGNYQGGLTELFEALDVKADAAAVAQELDAAFRAALTEACAAAVTPGFKAFVKGLTARGLKVVVATRADLAALRPASASPTPSRRRPTGTASGTPGAARAARTTSSTCSRWLSRVRARA